MKPLTEPERNTVTELALTCTEIKPDGFRIDLSKDPEAWAAQSRALGSKRLCAGVSKALSEAYEERYGTPFLFSERCLTFEIRYHLNAFLSIRGLRRVRHVSTLLFPKPVLERACRTIEIDTTDAYRFFQRLAFRYFFGIRADCRKTDRDPYMKRIGGRRVRVPFYRLFGGR